MANTTDVRRSEAFYDPRLSYIENKVVEMRRNGFRPGEIADELEMSVETERKHASMARSKAPDIDVPRFKQPRGQREYKPRRSEMWPPERVALLRQRWAEGLEARAIAKELGCFAGYFNEGASAIIGKARRLKLAARPQTPAKPKQPRRERVIVVASPRRPGAPPAPRPAPKPRIYSDDPASLVVAALLSNAQRAERRRSQYRSQCMKEGMRL